MVDTKELAKTTSNFNFCCLPLPCIALICSCSGESWVSSCASVSGGLRTEPTVYRQQSYLHLVIHWPKQTSQQRMTKLRNFTLWKLLSSLLGCWSLLKYAVCPYVANHAQRVVQSCTFCTPDYYTAAHNACMHPLEQSFLLVSTMKKKILIYPSAMTERYMRCEIERKAGRESEERKQGIEIYRGKDGNAETKKQRV